MRFFSLRNSFRNRILFLFIFFSILPLLSITLVVSYNVRKANQEGLTEFFNRYAYSQEQILLFFFESNKSWIRSLSAQDILLTELDAQLASGSSQTTSVNKNSDFQQSAALHREKLFASLTSIAVENLFIEKAYIVDDGGRILVSTTTNDVGEILGNAQLLSVVKKERSTYIGEIYQTDNKKRVIPLSAPLIRKSDNAVMGVLIIELNTSIIKSLFEGSLYASQYLKQPLALSSNVFASESYVVDNDGYILTKGGITSVPPAMLPFSQCRNKTQGKTGNWVSYTGETVYGVSRCVRLGDISWTLVVEQPVAAAYEIQNRIGRTILSLTAVLGIVLLFVLYWVSKSISEPIYVLSQGAREFGRGNLDFRIFIKTRDELGSLAELFNLMAGNLKDLFAKLAREKDLYASERNKLKVILSGIKDAVIAVDQKRNIILFNAASETLTGYSQNEAIGKPLDWLFQVYEKNVPLSTSIYCPIRKEGYEGIVYANEYLKLRTRSGKEIDAHLTTGQIRDGLQMNVGGILTIHDMTKERQLEEMKLDFVTMAAHELRTPLTAIRGYLSIFLSEVAETLTADQETYITRADLAAQRLSALVQNLLNVSRIERGTLVLTKETSNWSSIVRQVVEDFTKISKERKIALTLTVPDHDLSLVRVDRLRMIEVLSNILSNAVTYTAAGGSVSIRVEQKGSEVITHIQDTGEGIPKEAIPSLFTKFYRVSGKLEQGSKGTGLGLYISKQIINSHKGKIWVESEIGKGSTFSFSIPVTYE